MTQLYLHHCLLFGDGGPS